ncbi:helix-turn-helix domain-containing protein [Tomitella gaofuii]|uniref:helix-turn-helix domain-containing protein n=1 Tax=Tomitella gaofuii TaxID=2760083 RepID=UPI001F23F2A0|nr:helix-turn-helix domain-containing protein [Tomitella gaofuii]
MMGAVRNGWLTTSEAAGILGVSRQHVVDLCDRGELNCTTTGTHRRIRRCDIDHLLAPRLTREQAKSLWLHRALLAHLVTEPDRMLETARENIRVWKMRQRPDGMAARYLQQWEHLIDGGVEDVAAVLTGTDERSRELRQNSPFAGVLADPVRRQVLRSFREYWDRRHVAA